MPKGNTGINTSGGRTTINLLGKGKRSRYGMHWERLERIAKEYGISVGDIGGGSQGMQLTATTRAGQKYLQNWYKKINSGKGRWRGKPKPQ